MNVTDLLSLLSTTILVVTISFMNPWLRHDVTDKVYKKMHNDPYLTSLFVLSLAYSYTQSGVHSLFILTIFFGLKSIMLKWYT